MASLRDLKRLRDAVKATPVQEFDRTPIEYAQECFRALAAVAWLTADGPEHPDAADAVREFKEAGLTLRAAYDAADADSRAAFDAWDRAGNWSDVLDEHAAFYAAREGMPVEAARARLEASGFYKDEAT